ncbi:MAG: threonylcarbamoyl-AMP synthase [Acidobacteria bacterium]|nr:threonylcarbamoyl-AMP synthase [Acidobacteriota bacterium]
MSNRLQVDLLRPVPYQIREVRLAIENGGLIVYPTDTFYALGADPFQEAAVEKIFTVKGREGGKPILVLVSDMEQARRCAITEVNFFDRLASAFWPGPLTIVLPARKAVPRSLTAGTGTIGIRWPGRPEVSALVRELGGALTGTSANLSGGPNPSRIDMIPAVLLEAVDLVLDAGETRGGAPSTLVDLTTSPPRILREGALPRDTIERLLGFPIDRWG